jgi:hypothetical protein
VERLTGLTSHGPSYLAPQTRNPAAASRMVSFMKGSRGVEKIRPGGGVLPGQKL